METPSREDRLWAELEGLRSLKRQSSLFDFESEGEPPESFTVTFIGKGIASIDPASKEAVITESHQIQIQMAYLFPQREPDLKWLTPIYHPNLSKSGFVDMKDIGLEWSSEISLEIICERLWDVIRLAHVELDNATFLEAKEWFKNNLTLKLPIDARPLRDRAVASQSNVIQYSRRNKINKTEPKTNPDREVLFIGDEKATQPSVQKTEPTKSDAPVKWVEGPQPEKPDDDILFID